MAVTAKIYKPIMENDILINPSRELFVTVSNF